MNTVLHPNQSAMAKELNIDVAALASAEEAVNAIEIKLGKAALETQARWFVISVLRHLKKAKWTSLDDSAVDEKQQRRLAKKCLLAKGFATSLGTVTKDSRSKFRIVGFASSKNIDRGMLATGTKAYTIAASIVMEAGLVEEQAEVASKQPKSEPKSEPKPGAETKSKAKPEQKSKPKTQPEPKPTRKRAESKAAEKSVVARRAKRRGYVDDETMQVTDTGQVPSNKTQAVSMSKEEFASLDAALSRSDAEIVQKNWEDQSNEDRWSVVLGILAGVGFFVFVALLFL